MAIKRGKEAVAMTPHNYLDRVAILTNLAASL